MEYVNIQGPEFEPHSARRHKVFHGPAIQLLDAWLDVLFFRVRHKRLVVDMRIVVLPVILIVAQRLSHARHETRCCAIFKRRYMQRR